MTGLCECGCEKPTNIAKRTNRTDGDVKGEARRYLPGHNNRGREYGPQSEERKRKQVALHLGENHWNWKGGRIITSGGYTLVQLASDHPFYAMTDAKGYVREHRLVMAEAIGRMLRPEEEIHHVDEDRQNNRLDNLMLFANKSEHRKHHLELRKAST